MMLSSSPYQGVLGYFLLIEIFAVVGLSWLFIAMMIRRIRFSTDSEWGVPESQNPLAKIEDHPEYLALITQNQMLQKQLNEKNTPVSQGESTEEVDKLKSTIQFLEKKLLEYEIVQEEISALGDLKVENEKLKLEMQKLKAQNLSDSAESIKEQDLKTLLSDIEGLAESDDVSLRKKTG